MSLLLLLRPRAGARNGSASFTVTAGIAVAGTRTRFGAAGLGVTAGISTAAVVERFGTAILGVVLGVATDGFASRFGVVAMEVLFGADTRYLKTFVLTALEEYEGLTLAELSEDNLTLTPLEEYTG